MKRIIEGKMYNTDTATCIGSYEYSNLRDYHYLYEELYQKRNGKFFLSGEGGPPFEIQKVDRHKPVVLLRGNHSAVHRRGPKVGGRLTWMSKTISRSSGNRRNKASA